MRILLLLSLLLTLFPIPPATAYQAAPGRRLVALPLDAGKVFFSWRYKDSDGPGAKYEIKRSDFRTGPFTMAGIFRQGEGTCFIDSATVPGNTYYYFATTPSGISRTLEIPIRPKGQDHFAVSIRKNSSVEQLVLGDPGPGRHQLRETSASGAEANQPRTR